jgi:hypothetical protein
MIEGESGLCIFSFQVRLPRQSLARESKLNALWVGDNWASRDRIRRETILRVGPVFGPLYHRGFQ